MPVAPYPVSGVIRNRTNTANLENARVFIINTTTRELSGQQLTNSAGEFLIDLSNMMTEYANGNRLQIVAFDGFGSGRIVLERRHTVDTATGFHDTGQLILRPGDYYMSNLTTPGAKRLMSYNITNRTASAAQVHLFDRYNDSLVIPVELPANTTVSFLFDTISGVEFQGGICTILSSEGMLNITYPGDASATPVAGIVVTLVVR